mgnify:FL=1
MYFIGIDLGTSAVKMLLMRDDGKIVNSVTKSYPISFPYTGWSEQNPEDWLRETKRGLIELMAEYPKEELVGISFGGQMHGLVVLDENDRVIRPAILWNDGRSSEETEFLNTSVGRNVLSERTANIAFAGFTLPKILWMKKHEPDLFSKIRRIMLPKDYLIYMLSGEFCTDFSDASGTLLLDVKNRSWSKEMLELCNLNINQLPKLCESYEQVGTLRKEVAEELDFKPTVKIIAGAGDNAAAAIGTGTIGEGRCNISLGTSGTIFISSTHFKVDSFNALHSFAHADGNFHLMGCMLSAASANQWWCKNILGTTHYDEEQANIQKLGENNVYFLPYLMGERSPHNNPFARAMFVGMSLDTNREDMVQAVLEGVAFGLRDSFEIARGLGIKVNRTKICGGGAKSLLWCKIIANVMNVTVEIPEQDEGPALGAAILAAVGSGFYQDLESAVSRIVRVKDSIEPEEILVKKYEQAYWNFRKLYPAIKDWYGK